MMIFSEQDAIKDPPFSRLDLISCRNLLIYMGSELHKKLIPLFHYSLNPGGAFFLGTAETVGESHDLFSPLDRKAKLFLRKETAGAFRAAASRVLSSPADAGHGRRWPRQGAREGALQLRALFEKAFLQWSALFGALVTERGDILYLHGRGGRYLEPVSGKSGMNILKMAREGLRRELTAALRKAAAGKGTVRCPGLRVRANGGFSSVDLTVRPASGGQASGEPLFLVILEEARRPAAQAPEASKASKKDAGLAALKRELQSKVADLTRSNNDMNNLLAGTGIGTVFVDHQLNIQRFTPAITQVINLIPTDVGRPVGHILSNLEGYDRLTEDLREVLDTLVPKEVEVRSKAGGRFILRIRPYRTLENVIEGGVVPSWTSPTWGGKARARADQASAPRETAGERAAGKPARAEMISCVFPEPVRFP